MSELLVEILSEEIPARMQMQAENNFAQMISHELVKEKLLKNSENAKIESFITPNRIGMVIKNIPKSQPDLSEEKKGPRINAPQKAINGFLDSMGFSSIEECDVKEDAKGAFYIAKIQKKGLKTKNIIPSILKRVILNFPWPKSMQWQNVNQKEAIKWIRPIRGILCLFDQKVIPFNLAEVSSGKNTRGHRFMSPKIINVKNFNEYKNKLLDAKVIIHHSQRVRVIQRGIEEAMNKKKFKILQDEQLLNETAGLTEWPVIHIGEFNPDFLKLPKEVIIATLRNHQKCFSVKYLNTEKLAPKYIIVANIETKDQGKKITEGYNKVVHARLKDAQFFQQQDIKIPLRQNNEKLKNIIFHSKIGTQYERTKRIAQISRQIAKNINENQTTAHQAAMIAKADLTTYMVTEFPELQGIIGAYYAKKQNINPKIAEAIEEQYKPKGPNDTIPKTKMGQIIALADKIDILAAFWTINQKPTGSRDPYALRRAALGIIRILLEGEIYLNLIQICNYAVQIQNTQHKIKNNKIIIRSLTEFILERLKILLRQKNIPQDHMEAVLNQNQYKENLCLPEIIEKLHIIKKLTQQKIGQKTIAAIERVENILHIEEEKDKKIYLPKPNPGLFIEKQEKELFQKISDIKINLQNDTAIKKHQNTMKQIKILQTPIHAFFDHVMINDPNNKIRQNRLKLLAQIRNLTKKIADFSKIENKNTYEKYKNHHPTP